MILSDLPAFVQIRNIFTKIDKNLKSSIETNIKLIGDSGPITQIVILLAYIRYYLQNNISGEIKVSVGKNMESNFFAMQVNDQEIDQIKPRDSLEIN